MIEAKSKREKNRMSRQIREEKRTKVAVLPCNSYSLPEVKKILFEGLHLIGDWSKLIRRGNRVLLKPNLLSPRVPEEGVTTHPAVVEATVQLVKDCGAKVFLGDSPGGLGTDLEKLWTITGMENISKQYAVPLINFEKEKLVSRSLGRQKIYIPEIVVEAEVMISLPKLKTHHLTVLTGAVKNMFGVIPGVGKVMLHRDFPHPEEFSRVLVEIYKMVKPHLTIMDAVWAMEGQGPSNGDIKKMNFLLIGEDGVAVDAIASSLVGIDPLKVPTTYFAKEQGVGESNLGNIEIKGLELSEARVESFRLPFSYLRWVPKRLLKFLARAMKVKPVVAEDTCRNCQRCVESCPVKAITDEGKGMKVVDYKRCILCLCCYEICPYSAVKLKKSLLAKLWG